MMDGAIHIKRGKVAASRFRFLLQGLIDINRMEDAARRCQVKSIVYQLLHSALH